MIYAVPFIGQPLKTFFLKTSSTFDRLAGSRIKMVASALGDTSASFPGELWYLSLQKKINAAWVYHSIPWIWAKFATSQLNFHWFPSQYKTQTKIQIDQSLCFQELLAVKREYIHSRCELYQYLGSLSNEIFPATSPTLETVFSSHSWRFSLSSQNNAPDGSPTDTPDSLFKEMEYFSIIRAANKSTHFPNSMIGRSFASL